MKIIYAAASAALLSALSSAAMVGPASAQAAAATCPTMTPPPAVPDINTAKDSDMNNASKAFVTWSTGARAFLECDRASIEAMKAKPDVAAYFDAVAKLKAAQDSADMKIYNERVASYNDAVVKANASSDAWNTARDAYNAKKKKPR